MQKILGIKVEVAHRALDDVDTTVKVFQCNDRYVKRTEEQRTLEDIDQVAADPAAKAEEYKTLQTYHAIIIGERLCRTYGTYID